jgi:hypothetical protein
MKPCDVQMQKVAEMEPGVWKATNTCNFYSDKKSKLPLDPSNLF